MSFKYRYLCMYIFMCIYIYAYISGPVFKNGHKELPY